MSVFNLIAIVLTLSALFGYLNFRFIKLPASIGVMLISLLFSAALILAQQLGSDIAQSAERLVRSIDFNTTLMQGMLSFLLFAGALNVNLEDLLQHKWSVAVFTVFCVICSTAIVGLLVYVLFGWVGLTIPLLQCLLFGALISPTDPIAVLNLLKQFGAPKSLEVNIAGEALFNDGVGVVVFLGLYELAGGSHELSFSHLGFLFLTEAMGGVALGLLLGWVTYRLLKSIVHYQVEVLLTLALVTGGYSLANALHASGPLAIVTAGIFIGNHGRMFAMSAKTRGQLDTFWELIDEILNAVLFVLIGLEVLIITLKPKYWSAAALTIPVVPFARFVSVWRSRLPPFRNGCGILKATLKQARRWDTQVPDKAAKEREALLGSALAANQRDGLGFGYIQEVWVGYTEPAELQAWSRFLGASGKVNSTLWHLERNQSLRFVKSELRGVRGIVCKVHSVEKARQYLDQAQCSTRLANGRIELDKSKTFGLTICLAEN